jgi:hypothetical protein
MLRWTESSAPFRRGAFERNKFRKSMVPDSRSTLIAGGSGGGGLLNNSFRDCRINPHCPLRCSQWFQLAKFIPSTVWHMRVLRELLIFSSGPGRQVSQLGVGVRRRTSDRAGRTRQRVGKGGTEVRIAPLAMLRVLSGGRLPAGISCPRTRCAFALAS